VLNVNVFQSVVRLGRRLAEAGREARAASKSVAGPAGEQVVEVVAGAVGEVVRAAVVGAVAAVVRGAARPTCPMIAPPEDPWGDDEFDPAESEAPSNGVEPGRVPTWARATRAAGSALSVAAGAAAAVPGGRVVAAGLGGLAAVAGLAARAAEPAE
jgi:hypothetical protein